MGEGSRIAGVGHVVGNLELGVGYVIGNLELGGGVDVVILVDL